MSYVSRTEMTNWTISAIVSVETDVSSDATETRNSVVSKTLQSAFPAITAREQLLRPNFTGLSTY